MARELLGLAATAVLAFACTGTISDSGGDDGPSSSGGPTAQAKSFGDATLYRLTASELTNTYLDLFGEPLELPTDLPQDDLLYGSSSIASAGASIAALEAEKYENATYKVLDQVWADATRRDALIGCTPASSNDNCVRTFFASFIKKAWRRPAKTDELDAIVALSAKVEADLADAAEGVKYGTAAILQSPHFLFRVELGEPVGKQKQVNAYSSWEVASRLSYLIQDSPPDAELIAAAEADELGDVESIRPHVTRLLGSPRARQALSRFFGDFLNLSTLNELNKNADLFAAMSPTLGASMRGELEHMFEYVVFDRWQGDFRELFFADYTFVNEELAKLYGIEDVSGAGFTFVELSPKHHRRGILTSAGFLAGNAHPSETSPTHRGRFVRIQLLCEDVPPPPPGVSTALPEQGEGAPKTLRERLEAHRKDPACVSCHEKMDPIGFAFESYDAIGAYRVVDDQGLAIDTQTDIDGTPVSGAMEAADVIGNHPAAGACIARRFYEHATGHLAEKTEEPHVQAVIKEFAAGNYDFKVLVAAVVLSEGFRFAAAPDLEAP